MTVEDFAAAGWRHNAPTGDWRDVLDKNQAGMPRRNLFNACVALREHPELKGRIAFNDFRGCIVMRGGVPWEPHGSRDWTDVDDLKATEWMQSRGAGVQVGSGIVREAVQAIAVENGLWSNLGDEVRQRPGPRQW
jgi:hypothetical protein